MGRFLARVLGNSAGFWVAFQGKGVPMGGARFKNAQIRGPKEKEDLGVEHIR